MICLFINHFTWGDGPSASLSSRGPSDTEPAVHVEGHLEGSPHCPLPAASGVRVPHPRLEWKPSHCVCSAPLSPFSPALTSWQVAQRREGSFPRWNVLPSTWVGWGRALTVYMGLIHQAPSWITALSRQRGLHNSMKLWAMPCRTTQDGCVIVESSDKTSIGGGIGKALQHSCLEDCMDRVAWRAPVHGVERSSTRLSTHTHQQSPRETQGKWGTIAVLGSSSCSAELAWYGPILSTKAMFLLSRKRKISTRFILGCEFCEPTCLLFVLLMCWSPSVW